MRALIEALEPSDQFESSAAHPVAIRGFELAALSLSSAGGASLHGDNYILVELLDICDVETTVTIVHGQCAGRRR